MSSQFLANLLIDNVFIGSRYAAEDDQFLEQNQIKGIVNLVRHIVPNRFSGSFVSYLSFSIQENGVLLDEEDRNLSQTLEFMQKFIKNDEQVLIQSEYGENRGVVFSAAYLIHRFHWPPNEALQFVGANRPDIKPTQQFLSQLKKFAERRKAKYGPFKNIFSLRAPPAKMNDMELICRNTYLNFYKIDELEARTDLIVEKQSAIEAFKRLMKDEWTPGAAETPGKQAETKLRPENAFQTPQISTRATTKQAGSAGSIFQKPPESAAAQRLPTGAARRSSVQSQRGTQATKTAKQPQKAVKFRDGLTYSQPDVRGAKFDQYNKPVFRSYSSALFRGKTSSYRSNQVTCNLPLLSEGLIDGLVSLGIDYDVPGVHRRRKPENELVNNFNALVRSKAVSILMVSTEASRKFVQDAPEQMLISEYTEQLEKQRSAEFDRFGLELDDFSVGKNTQKSSNQNSQPGTKTSSTRNTSISSQNDDRPETYNGPKKQACGVYERTVNSTDDRRQPMRKFRDVPMYGSVQTERAKTVSTTTTNFNQYHSINQPYISSGGFKGSNKTRPAMDSTFPRLSASNQPVQLGIPSYSMFAKQTGTTNPISHLPTVDQKPVLKKLYKHSYK